MAWMRYAVVIAVASAMIFVGQASADSLSDVKKAVRDALKNASVANADKVAAIKKFAQFSGGADAKTAVKELLAILDDKTLFTSKEMKKLEEELVKAEAEFRKIDSQVRVPNGFQFGGGKPSQQEYKDAQARLENARMRLNAGNDCKTAVTDTLAEMTSAEARAEILAGLKHKNPECAGACAGAIYRQKYTDAFDALAACYDANTDSGVRAIIILALKTFDAARAKPYLMKALNDENCWLGRAHAVAALREVRAKETVEALVDRIGKEGPGRLRWDICEALRDLTGKDFDDTATSWRSWWSGAAANFTVAPRGSGRASNGGPVKPESTGTSFYGLPVRGNPLFIIDRSGSMLESSKSKSNAQAGQPLPPGEESKWAVLQKELFKAIKGLPEKSHFGIVWFETEVDAYKSGAAITATAAEKAAAEAAITEMKANGLTNIYGAFERGFECLKPGGPGGSAVMTGPGGSLPFDEIFFMTDGSPTVGKAIDGVSPSNGGTPKAYIDKLVEKICEWNKPFNLVINCICVGEGDENFLRRLAERNRGKFTKAE